MRMMVLTPPAKLAYRSLYAQIDIRGYKCKHDEVPFGHLSNSSQTKGGTNHNGHISWVVVDILEQVS